MLEAKYKIIDKLSQSVLYEFSLSEVEAAYQQAKALEALDLDIELIGPTLSESFLVALGGNLKDISALNDELNTELLDHPNIKDSCCLKSE